jgi:catechol 2,3-dioxygenase-like lactoylglutathione lyase family enzyme
MTEPKTPPPTIVNHVSLGTADFDKAAAFYDRVLTTSTWFWSPRAPAHAARRPQIGPQAS